jgi:transcriptional regulator with XRE-family HTH domain
MPRRIRGSAPRRQTFLRQWRKSRDLTLERAADRFNMSAAQLWRIETGEAPYTQDFLELAARAYRTDVASLLMRDPTDPEALWSIWENALPGERRQIEELAKVITRKTGS